MSGSFRRGSLHTTPCLYNQSSININNDSNNNNNNNNTNNNNTDQQHHNRLVDPILGPISLKPIPTPIARGAAVLFSPPGV